MNVRNVLLKTGLPGLLPANLLAAVSGQKFILPFYHIVSDEPCPHIKNLYRVKTSKEFEDDLDFLLKHYQPIATSDLNDVLAGKFSGKNIFLLSFDDGLREVHDVIAPILLRKSVPAVFFLNSDFIDNKALMFRYKVSLLIEQIAGKDNALAKQLKTERADSTFIKETAEKLAVDFDAFLKERKPYLSTEQVKSLMIKGFTIGAHSCNHPYYEDISLDEQLKQTFDSLLFLQQHFAIKEKLFAFPFTDFGVSQAFFDSIFKENKIDFSFGGAGFKKDVSPFHFQRLAMEHGMPAEQIIGAEYLYYLLKAPLFKNTINRQ